MELILNEISTIKLVGFRPFQCIILASGKQWSLAKLISSEYIEDGYVFINNKYVSKNAITDKDFIAHKILSFRGIDMYSIPGYDLECYRQPFDVLVQTGELIQFFLKQEDIGYVGRVKKVNKESCIIQLFSTKGVWLKEFNFKYNSIRNFQIKGNYLDSLSILINIFEL